MRLTPKQMALFGQVRVNVLSLDSNCAKYITLLELYKNGWWITHRFGSVITLVKPRCNLKSGFCCMCKKIDTDINLDSLDTQTKIIADIKYEKYKNYLNNSKKRDLHKVNINENDLSML